MKKDNLKKSLYNIVLSFMSQLILLGLGFVLPRLILTSLGSEINGLLSSVNQVFSYLELLRAGMGMAAIQALYKPITQDDYSTISRIVYTSKQYFIKMGYLYLTSVFLVAFIYAKYGDVSINRYQVLFIIILQGASGWLTFSYISYFTDLLRAEGKNYVILLIQTTGKIAIQTLKVVVLVRTKNMILMMVVPVLITVIEIVAFSIYRNKKYTFFNIDEKSDLSLLKNRKSYFIFHLTGLINTSTDILVISAFLGFEMASVYSVYYLIASAVTAIINTIYSSTSFLLGHAFQTGLEQFKKVHDAYYLIYTTLTTSLFSVCYLLMKPFIVLYTENVVDIEYTYKYLPLLFCLIQVLTCSKNVGDITINIGGYAKKVVWRSILEAILNIVLSLILVNFIGIYGVLIGTVISLTYRVIDVLWFSNKYVINRKPIKNSIVLFENIMLFFAIVVFEQQLTLTINSFYVFLKYAMIITPIILVVFLLIIFITNYKDGIIIIQAINNYLRSRYKTKVK